jgi:hypothetical protein
MKHHYIWMSHLEGLRTARHILPITGAPEAGSIFINDNTLKQG